VTSEKERSLPEEPKTPKEIKNKTFFELWSDSRWGTESEENKDIYEPKQAQMIVTRAGRRVQPVIRDDMIYYK